MQYRIREARIEVCNGRRCWHERRFSAERRVILFGLLPIWWPVLDWDWRATKTEAKRDIERDAQLRAPLSEPEFITTEGRP